jgi:hypothetical protein
MKNAASKPADLPQREPERENTIRLASRFRARELDLEAERQVARVVLEAGGTSEQSNGNGTVRGYRPPGDRWAIRGIPAVGGRGSVGGAIFGTTPGSDEHLDEMMRWNGRP